MKTRRYEYAIRGGGMINRTRSYDREMKYQRKFSARQAEMNFAPPWPTMFELKDTDGKIMKFFLVREDAEAVYYQTVEDDTFIVSKEKEE